MPASTDQLSKALDALERALKEPKNDITRDASIQRFEFCVELAWKTSQKLMGTTSTAPKVVVREMAQQGLVSDAKLWLGFLEARNLSSDTYREEIAEKVYAEALQFLPHGRDLLKKLKKI